MKRSIYLLVLIVAMATSCKPDHDIQLLLTNPLDQHRKDAAILLSRSEITEWVVIPPGKVPLLIDSNGKPVPCQVDDLDGDGEWDELFALTDLEPSAEMSLFISFIPPEEFPEFKVRTNVRMGANQPGYPELQKAERLVGVSYSNHGLTGKAYQMEGPAWENDLVGFRNYLDQRNAMDIYGKITGEMVLDSVGVKGRQSYHEPDNWGMDVLLVGTSLGSGGIAYMFNDSMYRVGDNGTGDYELLFEGSQRSRFNLTFDNWEVEGIPLKVTQQVEIVAGRYCFHSKVTYSGTDEILDLVTGIVNIKSDSLYMAELNGNYTMMMTHDYQSEDTSLLSMALIVPTPELIKWGETPDKGDGITQTYYAALDARPGQPEDYWFYSFWEKEDPRWASADEVIGYLKDEADRLAFPVEVRLKIKD